MVIAASTVFVAIVVACVLILIPHWRIWQFKKAMIELIDEEIYREAARFAFADLVKRKTFNELSFEDRQMLVKRACGMGRYEIVKEMYEQRVDLNFIDDEKDTPFLAAVTSNSPELVRFLLEHGADVNHTNQFGYNALKAAVWARRPKSPEILTILMDAGAKPYEGLVGDQSRADPLKSAIKIGDTNMIASLLSRMSNVTFTTAEQKELLGWCGIEDNDASKFLSNYFAQKPTNQ